MKQRILSKQKACKKKMHIESFSTYRLKREHTKSLKTSVCLAVNMFKGTSPYQWPRMALTEDIALRDTVL